MIGLVVAATALALAAVPAWASKEKPKIPTGNFIASVSGGTITPATPAIAKSTEGEISKLTFGGIPGLECKGASSVSKVEEEVSPNLNMELSFKSCKFPRHIGIFTGGGTLKFKEPLHLQLHANGSVKIMTIGLDETEVHVGGFKCKITIPAQEIPLSAESKEGEFEAVEYSTEKETVEGSKLKKFPRGFFELLEVEFVKMKSLAFVYKPEEGGREAKHCGYTKDEEGQFNPETGLVEGKWAFEADLEEIKIKNGSIGFEPPV
jgi:hypothetical protein